MCAGLLDVLYSLGRTGWEGMDVMMVVRTGTLGVVIEFGTLKKNGVLRTISSQQPCFQGVGG
jgi:hypothetical protein